MKLTIISAIAIATVLILGNSCRSAEANDPENSISQDSSVSSAEMIERGGYLVTIGGCNDCHTTKVMTPYGMGFDSSKMLAGHIANPQAPKPGKDVFKPGNWGGMDPMATAFAGPWGISYAANLTPDVETGIGSWKESDFINTLRTGRHLGVENGRELLPPMPWFNFAKGTDEDLKAIFAYLQSLKPIKNKVPAASPPAQL